MEDHLDAVVQRLQCAPDFPIPSIEPDGTVGQWQVVPMGSVVSDLVVRDASLADQVALVSARIAHWARITSYCRRAWQIQERRFRVWKNQQVLEMIDPEEKAKDWKKPTQQVIEATYRVQEDYSRLSEAVEAAEESTASAQAIVDAFKAQRSVLEQAIRVYRDGGGACVSV